jgi:hypothetical protein
MKTLVLLCGLLGLVGCNDGSDTMEIESFWTQFRQDELGSTKLVQPGFNLGDNGTARQVKAIELHADDRYATPMLISLRAEYGIDENTISPVLSEPTPGVEVIAGGNAGTGIPLIGFPLVARLEWGTGGGRNAIEFDIPSVKVPGVGPLDPVVTPPASQPVIDPGQGVMVYISASAVTVTLRHDGNLAPLSSFGAGFGNAVDRIGSPLNAKVKTFV